MMASRAGFGNWPSAQKLGSVYRDIGEEFMSRVKEAHRAESFTTADGRDPNDWKNEAIGRAFGQVYEELVLDGFDMKLKAFLLIIQARIGRSFTTFGDDPFTKKKARHEESLFWRGLTAASEHARALQAEGGIQ